MAIFARASGFAVLALITAAAPAFPPSAAHAQNVFALAREFPLTDFSKRSIDLKEIWTGRPRRGSFPTINEPRFVPATTRVDVGPLEPVLSVGINGDFRAYPLRILLFHELVNDVVGGVPILVSYCPLCNSGVVFDRRLDGNVLRFDNTGRLRHLDMLIYDTATESWWQQFLGEAIVGEYTGRRLDLIPARTESLAKFRDRAPGGLLMVPENPDFRPYGLSSHVGEDDIAIPPALVKERFPFDLPEDLSPLERIVVVGEEAWLHSLVREETRIESGDLVITWEGGQNSLHDRQVIADGHDVGNVIVQRRTDQGLVDVPYDVSFLYAFFAFKPEGTLHRE